MNAATLLAGALAGGADRLSPRDCWLCLAYLYSTGNSAQIQIDAAIAAGCDRLSDGDIEKCLAYMLTSGSSPVPGPVNLIPAGAAYSAGQSLYEYDVPQGILQPGATYLITFGGHEYYATIPGGNPKAIYVSGQFTTNGAVALLQLFSQVGGNVTATLVQV